MQVSQGLKIEVLRGGYALVNQNTAPVGKLYSENAQVALRGATHAVLTTVITPNFITCLISRAQNQGPQTMNESLNPQF